MLCFKFPEMERVLHNWKPIQKPGGPLKLEQEKHWPAMQARCPLWPWINCSGEHLCVNVHRATIVHCPNVWQKTNTARQCEHTIHTVKHCVCSILLWGCFSSAGAEKMVRLNGKTVGAKYRAILKENLLELAKYLRLQKIFHFLTGQ